MVFCRKLASARASGAFAESARKRECEDARAVCWFVVWRNEEEGEIEGVRALERASVGAARAVGVGFFREWNRRAFRLVSRVNSGVWLESSALQAKKKPLFPSSTRAQPLSPPLTHNTRRLQAPPPLVLDHARTPNIRGRLAPNHFNDHQSAETTTTTTAAPDPDDPWLAPDKLQHFGLSALGTLGAYWFLVSGARGNGGARPAAAAAAATTARPLALAALIAAALGLLKELGDGPFALWPGRASLRDGVADALGILVAVIYVLRGGPLPRRRRRGFGGGAQDDDDDGDALPLVDVMLRPPS
jgi:hypothetical protein